MRRLLVVAALAGLAGTARAADPPKDDSAWFAPKGKAGAVPSTYDLGARGAKGADGTVSGTGDLDVLVERFRRLPTVKPPEPEQRDVFESDRPVNSLDDKIGSTRSGSRDGCHAGTVCYGDAPRLRDSLSNLFGD